jgi:glycerol uptake facilitator-like aquaporin
LQATAHTSGGQLNPAVSLALCCVGALPPAQTVLNVIAQIVGAITGSAFVAASVPRAQRGSLGSNSLSNGVGYGNALCAEIVMTCVLVLVVLETAVNRKSVARAQAPLAIGFAVRDSPGSPP